MAKKLRPITAEQGEALRHTERAFRKAREAGETEVVLTVSDAQRVLQVARGYSRPDTFMSHAEDVARWGQFLGGLEHEEVWILAVDNANTLIGQACVARGGADGAALLPRDIFRPAMACGACAIVLVHNHPSGDPTPSGADVALTERARAAGRQLGIPLLDHVVIARGGKWKSID